MSGTLILLELAGYVGLLLWGTHMVASGVQRGFGAELRVWLGQNLQQRWRAFLVGVGVTAALQSSTATGLIATSFTVTGLIGLGPGLAVPSPLSGDTTTGSGWGYYPIDASRAWRSSRRRCRRVCNGIRNFLFSEFPHHEPVGF